MSGVGFEEGWPVWEDDEGGEGDDAGEEPGSFGRRLAGGLPRGFEQVENGMPRESQQVKGGHHHRQKLFAVAEACPREGGDYAPVRSRDFSSR